MAGQRPTHSLSVWDPKTKNSCAAGAAWLDEEIPY